MNTEIYDVIDIDSLSIAKNIDLSTTRPSTISSVYSPFFLFVENRNSNDEPFELRYNLYDLYKFGLDNLIDETDSKLTVGESITVESKFFCEGNFAKIGETFKEVDTKIDYDEMNSILEKLQYDETKDNYAELSSVLWKWVNDNVYDFSVKQNPEDADDSNLILTKEMLEVIKPITQSIIDKIYRNFTQLIRVRHDYRLYGKGATIFGGSSKEISSTSKVGSWSKLPSSCWTQYKGQYIVGKSAYDEEIKSSSGSGNISNSTYSINPYRTFGVAAHKHSVSMNIGSINSNIQVKMNVYSTWSASPNGTEIGRYYGDTSYNFYTIREQVKRYLPAPGGIYPCKEKNVLDGKIKTDITANETAFSCDVRYKYYWNSDNCKLVSPDGASNNLYSQKNVVLPTYSSYVWKWTGEDNTSVSSLT